MNDSLMQTQCYQCSIDSALILHQCSIDSAKALDVDVPARMKAIGPDLVAADAGAMEEAEKVRREGQIWYCNCELLLFHSIKNVRNQIR